MACSECGAKRECYLDDYLEPPGKGEKIVTSKIGFCGKCGVCDVPGCSEKVFILVKWSPARGKNHRNICQKCVPKIHSQIHELGQAVTVRSYEWV